MFLRAGSRKKGWGGKWNVLQHLGRIRRILKVDSLSVDCCRNIFFLFFYWIKIKKLRGARVFATNEYKKF